MKEVAMAMRVWKDDCAGRLRADEEGGRCDEEGRLARLEKSGGWSSGLGLWGFGATGIGHWILRRA